MLLQQCLDLSINVLRHDKRISWFQVFVEDVFFLASFTPLMQSLTFFMQFLTSIYTTLQKRGFKILNEDLFYYKKN
jgi:hypothetical protein